MSKSRNVKRRQFNKTNFRHSQNSNTKIKVENSKFQHFEFSAFSNEPPFRMNLLLGEPPVRGLLYSREFRSVVHVRAHLSPWLQGRFERLGKNRRNTHVCSYFIESSCFGKGMAPWWGYSFAGSEALNKLLKNKKITLITEGSDGEKRKR